ncbi:MAG TPA: hypothetical protein VH135_02695, partial [Steroidobacteraceae bacterium]|nr:hypothetical protein [Steroidobacteraceae bacterium]
LMDASPLAGWDNFYVIVGSSAGGLTGLTFVVIALIRDSAQGVRPTGLGAFVTPTIVHLSGVLALAAFMSMPHQRAGTLSVGLAIGGFAGVVYGCFIGANMWRVARGATLYIPVREDWIWNVILPTAAYAALTIMAVLLWDRFTEAALYGVAVLALALLFISIRNAWDIAVWMSVKRSPEKE